MSHQPSSLIEQQIKQLIIAAQKAPSSFNLQHARYIAITDEPLIKQFIQMHQHWSYNFLPTAILLILGEQHVWSQASVYAQHLDLEHQRLANIKATHVYADKNDIQHNEMLRTCGLATTNILWKARTLSLGSELLFGLTHQQIQTIIHIPTEQLLISAIAFDQKIPLPLWQTEFMLQPILTQIASY